MKLTDYIVTFLIRKNITDVFGYPGGVICHFIDSLSKYPEIQGHINYHEQASAFAACGYAQEMGLPGVAYATSGPGATNLVTGIANAYFDSIPTIFLTGQVDTYALKGSLKLRQKGFQECDVVGMVRPITKYAVRVDDPLKIRYELEKAYYMATSGNPGPVLLDLPADVQRSFIEEDSLNGFYPEEKPKERADSSARTIFDYLTKAKRPCLLLGNGIKQCSLKEKVREIVEKLDIPVVSSMPAVDILPENHKNFFGFIGANGHRYGNFVLGKSDLIISMGSRMDVKQVGNKREDFAKQAKILRIDIDEVNLEYKVHQDELSLCADLRTLIPELSRKWKESKIEFSSWRATCEKIKKRLRGYDDTEYTSLIKAFSEVLDKDWIITADVGQSEVWVAQQFSFKEGQSFHLSGGHGAMGYSLPAAIGAYYGGRKAVISFTGDGGLQMNIQELQFLSREQIPVMLVILNNHALGMIRGFQDANFDKNYQQTTKDTGYTVPDFEKLAGAYGISYQKIENKEDIRNLKMEIKGPCIVEIQIREDTFLNPNFGQNGLIQDQRPYLERAVYEEIMQL